MRSLFCGINFHATFHLKVLTLDEPWYDLVPVSFCKFLKVPADRMYGEENS